MNVVANSGGLSFRSLMQVIHELRPVSSSKRPFPNNSGSKVSQSKRISLEHMLS